MRILLFCGFMVMTAVAMPVGWVTVEVDSLPASVYLNGRLQSLTEGQVSFELSPGRHFVSLFTPQVVYRAYKDGAPETYWDNLFAQGLLAESDRHRLVSSYERGSIRSGTKWLYVMPDETLAVRLSFSEVQETYRRDSSGMLSTFVGWTLLIGIGMVLSVFLVKLG